MKQKIPAEASRLDDAARAGWLYYVAGNTQDEIARKLGVSRQSAQRLVSLAVSERLIKVRLDHPIANCMELSTRLTERFGLQSCEVVPSDPDAPSSTVFLPRHPVSMTPPAPAGYTMLPATPRTRSPASSAYPANRHSGWFRLQSVNG